MNFDSETINGFKKIISDGLAYGVFLYPNSFKKEVDGNHIATHLFQKPPHMQVTTLKLLKHYISNAGAKSVIGFSENDQALIAIVTQAAYDLNLPSYSYDLENDPGADSQFVRPEVVPCSIILPYSITKNQVQEVINRFNQQKVPIKQVIVMVEEKPIETKFSGKDFEYCVISDWASIKERIKLFKNLTDKKMEQLSNYFK